MDQVGDRYITALTDPQNPQNRLLLSKKTLQIELFAEEVCEAEADGVHYILRKNPHEAKRIRHRLDDKLIKLRDKILLRNHLVEQSARRKPEAGLLALQAWVMGHKMAGAS